MKSWLRLTIAALVTTPQPLLPKNKNKQWNEIEIRGRIKHLSEYKTSGRQIRNAITTARQLALFPKTPMSWEHLEHFIEVSGQFDKYLEEVHNQIKDDDMTREEGWR